MHGNSTAATNIPNIIAPGTDAFFTNLSNLSICEEGIVSDIPLKDVKIMVSTNSTKRVRAGIVPDGAQKIYNPKQLIGTAQKEDYTNNAKIGSIALWTLDQPDSQFSYSIDITRLTNVDENVIKGENIKVYPNPARDQLIVEMELQQEQDINISLVDILGNELKSQTECCSGSLQTVMDIEPLPAGIYILKIKIGNELIHRKVVKE